MDNKNLLLRSLELDNQTLSSQLAELKGQSQNQTVLLESLQEKNQQLMERSELLEEQLNSSKILSESLSTELAKTKTNSLRSTIVWTLAGLICGGLVGYFWFR